MQALSSSSKPVRAPSIWLGGLACFMAIYLPMYWQSLHGLWEREEHAHGPLILMIVLWLFWQVRAELQQASDDGEQSSLGWLPLGAGLALYLLGSLLTFPILAFLSQPLVALGLLLLLGGTRAVKISWFPLFFLMFMVPLPGVLVDMATGALKQWVSVIAEWVLRVTGYPVGRTGVTLVVGPYQLLVADACSGLHSMFTLTAMGMLFMHIRARASVVHNGLMLIAILPIAFAANIFRVMALVLITYHLGDEAGRGFLHGAAGVFLMVAALLAFIAYDSFLALFTSKKR